MGTIQDLARETLVLVPLGLPFFVPFAIADRTGFSFWTSFAMGILLASLTIGAWFWFGRKPHVDPGKSVQALGKASLASDDDRNHQRFGIVDAADAI